MSFSKRESKWANAALVVSLSPQDVADDVTAMEGADAGSSPLRGVSWQSAMERRAADMGGGNLGEILFGVDMCVRVLLSGAGFGVTTPVQILSFRISDKSHTRVLFSQMQACLGCDEKLGFTG